MAVRADFPLEQDVKQYLFAEYGRTLMLAPGDGDDPDALFERVCAEFENTKIEQDEEGNVYIMAPVGAESSDQNAELTMQLRTWAKQDGRGRAFGPDAEFIFPNRSTRGPDAAWVGNEKLAALPRSERRKFARIIPDFVVELKSPSDRISKLNQKMLEYRRNGVELGWLIDPDQRTVWLYRTGDEAPEAFNGDSLAADGPVAGFVLDLKPIWQGLDLP
ncbi:MAG: Uma2 family endonuclease [Bryobacteraceae bacterium]